MSLFFVSQIDDPELSSSLLLPFSIGCWQEDVDGYRHMEEEESLSDCVKEEEGGAQNYFITNPAYYSLTTFWSLLLIIL